MAKLGDTFNTLATLAGISPEDGQLKAFLSNVAVSEYDLPDEIANKIQSSLLTIDAAKNHPQIKSHFFAQAYDGLDKELTGLMGDLPEEVKAEILAEKSSTKRASLLVGKVKELEGKKGGASTTDKAQIQKQIDDLNAAIVAEKQAAQQAAEAIRTEYESKITDLHLNNILTGYKYATPISLDANIKIAKTLLSESLAQKGLQVVNENGLTIKTKDNMDYYENNQKVDVSKFADAVLAQHKLLAANEPEQAPRHTPQNTTGLNAWAAEAARSAEQLNA
jgi:hypothetical protein